MSNLLGTLSTQLSRLIRLPLSLGRRKAPEFQHSVLHAVLGELQHRGHRGGRIMLHRSIWGMHLPRERLLGSLALATALTAVLLLLRNSIATLWAEEVVWWLQQIGVPGTFSDELEHGDALYQIALPNVAVVADLPQTLTLQLNALAIAVLWLVSGRLPDVARPGCFLLRFALIIHAAATLFFWLWPASFPHSVNEHIGNGLQQCWSLLLLAPWIHLGTYYLFDVTWAQRVAVTLLTWLYLFILAPLLYATHGWVMSTLGLLAMPLLHLLFGVMVAIIGFVAIYGVGMGWANARLHQS